MPTAELRKEGPPQSLKQRLAALLPLSLLRHIIYRRRTSRWGNFRRPSLYSEKMQWRIINDRRPMIGMTGDKLASADLAMQRCREAGAPLVRARVLVSDNNPAQLVAALKKLEGDGNLPAAWVLKPNHSSRRVLITRGAPDWDLILESARRWLLPDDMVGVSWMWAYEKAERKIIAEELITDPSGVLIEWSVYIFNGKAFIYNVTQRRGEEIIDTWRSPAWSDLGRMRRRARNVLTLDGKPEYLPVVTACAEAIGAGWDHVRVDLYWADGKVWFGETTAYPMEGTGFASQELDKELGDLWKPHES